MTPQFPPMMSGHELKAGQSPARKAVGGAVKGKYSAGDILWVRDDDTLDCAIVLEPEVSREEALSMVFTKMVAIGDAVGAIAPPEIAITYHWPNKVLANGALIGGVDAIFSERDQDGSPAFMVLAINLKVRPTADNIDPGLDESKTTLWDEGCGDLDAMQVLDSMARHFMTWIHTWEEEGMQPVLTQLDGRMEQGHALSFSGEDGTFLGLDEHANLIMKKQAGGSTVIKTIDALDTSLEAHLP